MTRRESHPTTLPLFDADLSEFEGRAPVEMLGKTRFPAVTARPYQLALAPFGFYWFRIEERSA